MSRTLTMGMPGVTADSATVAAARGATDNCAKTAEVVNGDLTIKLVGLSAAPVVEVAS